MPTFYQYKQMMDADDGETPDALTATGTTYTAWYDVSMFNQVTTFVEGVYTSQSGATVDVTVQTKNPRSGNAFDCANAHTQLTDDANNMATNTNFGGQIRLKIVAGGRFGGGPESVLLTYDFAGKRI